MSLSPAVAHAYSVTGGSWQHGPGRIYDRLAEVVVAHSPLPVAGTTAFDLGAGTGAVSRALIAAGAARVIAVDSALGMLAHDSAARSPAAAGDALALPLRDAAADITVAAFSLNHLVDPVAGLCEVRRLTRRGGALVVATYAADDTHPVKKTVEAALTARGWTWPAWYAAVRAEAVPKLATVERCSAAAEAAGLNGECLAARVPFPALGAHELVEWRLGMAQHAPFVSALSASQRRQLVADAVASLGDAWPPLERSILILRAVRG